MGRLTGLFVKQPRKIANIFVDTFTLEVHKREIELTSLPTELGININDHRIIRPARLTIEGVISNIASLNVRGVDLGFKFGADATRATSAYEEFKTLLVNANTIDVQTGLLTYNNMVLTSIEVERTSRTSGGLFFVANFQELIIVTTESSFLNDEKFEEGATREQAGSKNEYGRQSGEKLSEDETNRNINKLRNLQNEARA